MPISRIILIVCFYLSLVRGTNIGLFLPSSELMLGDIDYRLTQILNYILLLGIIAYLFITNNYKPLIDKILSPPAFIFLIACIISISLSVDIMQSIKSTIAIIAISLPIILYYYKYGTEALITETSRFIIALSILCFIYTILLPQYGIMSAKHAGAWRGLFPHKNGSGPFFAIGFYFLVNQLQNKQSLSAIALTPIILICVLFVFMSNSSTAIICFILMGCGYLFMQIIYRFRSAGERLGIFLFLVSFVLLISFFGASKFNEVLYQTTGKDMTFSGRTNVWEPLLDLSYERPLYGYGLGIAQRPEFMEKIHAYINFEAQSSHSSYLDLVLEIGYPGALFFFLILIKIFFSNLLLDLKLLSLIRQRSMFMATMLTLLLVGFTTSNVMLGKSVFWLFFLMSILALSSPKTQS